MLRVTSTVPEYLRLNELGRNPREIDWVTGYEAEHADVFAIYYDGYGNRSGRANAAALVPELAPRIAARESRALETVESAAADLANRRLIEPDVDLPVVMMVGTGHSDGWVTVVGDGPVLFLALEMLRDPVRDEILVTHELVHVIHVRSLLPLLAEWPDLENGVGMRVWLEGLAVAATRLLRPGHPDTDYLFASDDQWIRDCRAALPEISRALLPHLTVSDPAICYSLCGVTHDQPWPSRAGYWVGDQVVGELLDAGHELSELITWGPERTGRAFRESSLLSAP